jgi:hypothetical protein
MESNHRPPGYCNCRSLSFRIVISSLSTAVCRTLHDTEIILNSIRITLSFVFSFNPTSPLSYNGKFYYYDFAGRLVLAAATILDFGFRFCLTSTTTGAEGATETTTGDLVFGLVNRDNSRLLPPRLVTNAIFSACDRESYLACRKSASRCFRNCFA